MYWKPKAPCPSAVAATSFIGELTGSPETGTGTVHRSGVDGAGSNAPIPPAYFAVMAWHSPSTGHTFDGA